MRSHNQNSRSPACLWRAIQCRDAYVTYDIIQKYNDSSPSSSRCYGDGTRCPWLWNCGCYAGHENSNDAAADEKLPSVWRTRLPRLFWCRYLWKHARMHYVIPDSCEARRVVGGLTFIQSIHVKFFHNLVAVRAPNGA